jgi:hypothetical protein
LMVNGGMMANLNDMNACKIGLHQSLVFHMDLQLKYYITADQILPTCKKIVSYSNLFIGKFVFDSLTNT